MTFVIASTTFQAACRNWLLHAWRDRSREGDVKRAIEILRDKFTSVEDLGPGQVVEFFHSPDADAQAMQARRAFEFVQNLLSLL